jgi:hypothetical protein
VERPETLPGGVVEALGGYYNECPTLPQISDLQVARTWRSAEVKEPEHLSFKTVPPFTFWAVKFEPTDSEWYFRSTQFSVKAIAPGPRVNSLVGGVIDVIATCWGVETPIRLDVESGGGEWVVYLVNAAQPTP